jgi:dipeptidyl-peptidase-4
MVRIRIAARGSVSVAAAVLVVVAAGCAGVPPMTEQRPIDTGLLRIDAETWGFSAGHPKKIRVTPDGEELLFLRSGPRDLSSNLYAMDVRTGQLRGLLRADELLDGGHEALTDEEKMRRERMREIGAGLTGYDLSFDGQRILTSLSGRLYLVERSSGKVTSLRDHAAGPARDAKLSPDGRWASCIRGYDLYVTDLGTLEERAVTTGGTADRSNGVAEFVAQEEMGRYTGYWWSGDSRWMAFEQADQSDVEMLYIADARLPGNEPSARRYPRAGGTNVGVRLGIVPVTGGGPRWVEWDRERYPYLASVHWGKDSPLTVYVQSRDQRQAVLYRVEAESGSPTMLLEETDDAWINIDADMPKWLAGGGEFLWTSERSGQWQLELRAADGALKRTYRPGAARLYGVVAVDEQRREVVVSGAEDPTQTHLYRISLDRADVALLTRGAGVHGGSFARNGGVWVESASLSDGSVQQTVRSRDAAPLRELPSVAEQPPMTPRVELTTVDANGAAVRAAIIRPKDFIGSRKYPVIVYVYGGPSHTVVSAATRGYLRQQWLADQGFIVVCFDGRGTPRRGRTWERATAGNLIDLPLADQAAALKSLADARRELDLSRVGIYGWSFGGYFAAMAVCKMPEVFHAAVAGAPVTDWADYDTHYTERYMGLPNENADGYRACSVLTYADRLRRPLLLIHGTTDDNVLFAHTLKLAEALFRAGRHYDLLLLPGLTHLVPQPEVTIRLYERIAKYFQTHLQSPAAVN